MNLYGLVGKSLAHSFSKDYFTKKFTRENISDCRYENYELKSINQFPGLLSNTPDLRGLNVTIPYKETVILYLDASSKEVDEIAACNCIKISGGKSHGFNTDVTGFKLSLKPKLRSHHGKALILGSGGASRAVQYALKELRIEYTVVSRDPVFNQIGYEEAGDRIIRNHTLIINTTPLGMYPIVDDDPPIPYDYLTPKHFLFDLIYNPEKTRFLQQGEAKGAQISNGYEMLVFQAEESWRIWNS